ncbi:MAG TPA: type VII secretion protein EssC [Symbiobacteriaceae bacterium]|nr:type VII secretion protein EssC [Symbiobacteriaceae bacterium]
MSSPPVFQRSPRLHPELPAGEVEIPSPGNRPAAPAISPISLILSILPGLIGPLILMAFMRPAAGATRPGYLFYSLPMVLLGGMFQAGNYWYQKSKYNQALQDREEAYRQLLGGKEQELGHLRDRQVSILQAAHPSPGECLERVTFLDPRLWERSQQDADFLSLRLGSGAVPFSVKVKVPRQDQALNPDPLYGKAYALAAAFDKAPGAPIVLPLRDVEAAGMVGHRPAVLSAARNLVLQIAANHSPDEVKILAIFPEEEAAEWAWMRWLPHVIAGEGGTRLLAADRPGARALLAEMYNLLTQRKHQVGMQRDAAAPAPMPLYVFLLADSRLTANEPVLSMLLEDGARLGGYPVILADRREDLPKACRGIVEIAGAQGHLTVTIPRLSQVAFTPDTVLADQAERVARAMAPIRLQRMATAAEIPAQVTLFDMLGISRVDELDVRARWSAGAPDRSLAVPVGIRGGGEKVFLDLHDKAHGPHGLVAGATGSGKSELLQTMIAALAVSFHPHEVAFVMVDFKGGGTANAFKGLPHLIGTMTNLEEGNLAQRALDALKAELKRRQRVLAEADLTHINDYIKLRRKSPDMPPLPHLIIVADEFAELKQAQPEFMRELVSAVRVGRSLGVHLILATQKPAGVVDDQIWSNTRFRMCLRVERPEDSRDVLKATDAAGLQGAGRAYFQVGNNEIYERFQAAWGGAPYQPDHAGVSAHAATEIAEVGLDGVRYRLGAPLAAAEPSGGSANQLQVLIEHLSRQAAEAGIQPVMSPWLPPLPAYLPLDELLPRGEGWDGERWRPTGAWCEPIIGLLDDPEHQLQSPLALPLAEGHCLIYGAPGTGKTTLLQTLVVSLARAHSPEDVHIYLVDCSGRNLSLLSEMPHVGAVVLGDEAERVIRLMRWLLAELQRRKERAAQLGVSTLAAYRTAGGEHLPDIVVALDHYPVFATTYPDADEMLAALAREGSGLGLHLVMTANSPSAVRTKITSNTNMALTLQLAEKGEYSSAVGRTGGREPAPVTGRGLAKGAPPLEFQTAVPVPGQGEWDRTGPLRTLIRAMDQAWTGARPQPVRVLPEVVMLSDLIPSAIGCGERPGAVPIGLDVESLAPFCPDLAEGPHFLITGPAESGKTTMLQSWLLSLAAAYSPAELMLWLVDFGGSGLSPLRRLPHVAGIAGDGVQLADAVGALGQALQVRRQEVEAHRGSGGDAGDERSILARHPRLVLAIHDFDGFREGLPAGTKERLEQLIRRERGLGFNCLVSGLSTVFTASADPLCRAFRELQTGCLVGSTDLNDLSVFGARLPSSETGKMLPPGTGYYLRRGRVRKFRAATPNGGDRSLADWVRLLQDAAGVKS